MLSLGSSRQVDGTRGTSLIRNLIAFVANRWENCSHTATFPQGEPSKAASKGSEKPAGGGDRQDPVETAVGGGGGGEGGERPVKRAKPAVKARLDPQHIIPLWGTPETTRNPKPRPKITRNLKSATRNPKPETRNHKPQTRNPKPETRNPKSQPPHFESSAALPKPFTGTPLNPIPETGVRS